MNKRVSLSLVSFFCFAAFLLLPTPADSPSLLAQNGIRPSGSIAHSSAMGEPGKARLVSSYGKLPLSFEPNQGQAGERIKFLSRGRGYALFLTGDEAILGLRSPGQEAPTKGLKAGTGTQPIKLDVLRMKLLGADQGAQITGVDKLPGKSNYLIGKDPQKWRTNVPNYAKVRYQNVYPGIDLVYYGNQRQLEYDFVVAPGANPEAIALEIAGTKGSTSTSLAENGDLVIKTKGGEVRFHKPVVYQIENPESPKSKKQPVEGHFVLLAKNQIGFEVGAYDPANLLYIDPVISYGTYLGGPGSDTANGIAVDSNGNAYVTGVVIDDKFPVTAGAYDTICGIDPFCDGGHSDAFVTKLSADGSSLVYSTYLGGAGGDNGTDIAVDSAGNAVVSGITDSTDFPTQNPIQDHQAGGVCGPSTNPSPCTDAFVTKLGPNGAALVYSTYLGGGGQDAAIRLALDASGNAYVTGGTQSSDFPTLNAFQSVFGGGTCGEEPNTNPCNDLFVAKISSNGSPVYSTYLGGSLDDWAGGIDVDGNGSAYVTGTTTSADFPVTEGALQTSLAGFLNALVTKLDPSGAGLAYSTYLGGSYADLGNAIAVDVSGSSYVTGITYSTDFPTTPGAFDSTCGTDGLCNGAQDSFVSKLNADGSALIYSTYLGGSGGETPNDIAVDSLGIAYVAGNTHSADFPTANCHCSFGGGDSGDSFLSKLSAGGEGLIVSTNLGGGGFSSANGIALDSSRNAYATGMTWSPMFSTTSGAFQEKLAGPPDAFVIKLSDLASQAVIISPESLDFGEQLVGTTSDVMSVTVKNVGDAAATPIPPIDATGDFQVTHTCGSSIDPGTSCTLDVTFTPQETGTRSGALRSYDEDPGEWQEFLPLAGVGIAPALSASPISLDFNEQKVGTASEAKTVTVANAGSTPITISDVQAPANFTITNNCGSAVAAGGSCTLGVAFAPTATGSITEQVTIIYVGAGSPQSITVTGTGTVSAIDASPSSLTFEDQSVGSTSDTQTITLTSTGTVAANFSSIKATGDFTLTNNCGSSLAAEENCTLNVAFAPKAAGSVTGQVEVAYDGADSPLSISLSGVGMAPSLSVSPSSLSFDNQLVGTISEPQTVTVTNTGSTPVNISGIEGVTHFAHTHNCGTSLAAGDSCTLQVTFEPKAAGLKTEQVMVNHDGAGSPHAITMSGKGTDFALQSGTGGSSASVTAGETATYNLSVNPMGYSGEVRMKCQWFVTVPGGTSCSFSPSTINLDGTNPANVVLSISTTSRSMAPVLRQPPPPGTGRYPISHLVIWLLALAAIVSLMARRRRATLTLASLLLLVTLWVACGGGAPAPLPVAGTPAGTYSLSAVGTTSIGPVEEYPTDVVRSIGLTLGVN